MAITSWYVSPSIRLVAAKRTFFPLSEPFIFPSMTASSAVAFPSIKPSSPTYSDLASKVPFISPLKRIFPFDIMLPVISSPLFVTLGRQNRKIAGWKRKTTLSSRWWYCYNQCRWKIKFSYTEHTYNTSCQFNVTVHAMPYSRKYYNIIFITNYYLFWFCVVSILFLFENHHRYGCEWCTLRTHHWHCTIYCYAVFTLFWFASHPSCFILLFQYTMFYYNYFLY